MNQERVFQILLGPHMSEKAAIAAEDANQYVFKVAFDATKIEIQDFSGAAVQRQGSITCDAPREG